jgi:hypothetical protein
LSQCMACQCRKSWNRNGRKSVPGTTAALAVRRTMSANWLAKVLATLAGRMPEQQRRADMGGQGAQQLVPSNGSSAPLLDAPHAGTDRVAFEPALIAGIGRMSALRGEPDTPGWRE